MGLIAVAKVLLKGNQFFLSKKKKPSNWVKSMYLQTVDGLFSIFTGGDSHLWSAESDLFTLYNSSHQEEYFSLQFCTQSGLFESSLWSIVAWLRITICQSKKHSIYILHFFVSLFHGRAEQSFHLFLSVVNTAA